jgi:hypothetical protein
MATARITPTSLWAPPFFISTLPLSNIWMAPEGKWFPIQHPPHSARHFHFVFQSHKYFPQLDDQTCNYNIVRFFFIYKVFCHGHSAETSSPPAGPQFYKHLFLFIIHDHLPRIWQLLLQHLNHTQFKSPASIMKAYRAPVLFSRALPPGMVDGVLPFQDDLRNGDESVPFPDKIFDNKR